MRYFVRTIVGPLNKSYFELTEERIKQKLGGEFNQQFINRGIIKIGYKIFATDEYLLKVGITKVIGLK